MMLTPFVVLKQIMASEGYDIELTSGLDRAVGSDDKPSYHQIGLAIDVKGNFLTMARGLQMEGRLKAQLGTAYVVLFETKDSDGEDLDPGDWHFHIQLNTELAWEAFEDRWGTRSVNDTRSIATDPGGEPSGPVG